MSKLAPPDRNERDKIEKVLDKNFLVEAGAGSGKTSSLVKRMVSIIGSGDVEVRKMAAITFTRKAAAELKERFQNQLERTFREAKNACLKGRFEQALMDLDQCYLGTIHSFCARLLRERPVEAGLEPDFKELDDIQNKLLIEKAWESYLIELKVHNPQLLEKLNYLGIELKDLKPSFQRLSSFPDIEIAYKEAPEPDIDPAFEQLKSLVERAKRAIPSIRPDKDYDDLQKAVLRADRSLRFFDLSQKSNKMKIITLFNKEKSITQNRWDSKEEAKQYRDEFNELFRTSIEPAINLWLEYCHYHIMKFLLPGVKHFEDIRRELSALNFQDLLMKTAAMLKRYPEVREYFQGKYKCLLIDEFQDTDPIQSEIMFYLTGSNIQEQDWLKLVPKSGALFVVGDPKQSIYRFRRADIDTYNVVKELILKSGGEVLKLTANFRSQEDLGDWFNPTFKKLFPNTYTSYQAEFSSMDTIRPVETNKMSGIKILDVPEFFEKKDQIVEAEADNIARYIKWALDGNIKLARSEEEKNDGISEIPQPKDFMILSLYKDSIYIYARALERYGVPVKIAGGSSLKDSKEILELLKVFKALNDTDNQVALAAVLRVLYFGISDDELYQFKTSGGYFNIFSTIPDTLSGEVASKFQGAFEALAKYHIWTKKYSPAAALEMIINDLGLIPYTLSGSMGKSRCSYVFQILEMLRMGEISTAYSFNLLVEQFIAIMEADFEEELNILADDENAVRIMNLHKAKGLEASVVFLAQPYKNVNHSPEEHVKRINDIPQGFFCFSRTKRYHKERLGQPQNWEEHCAEENKYQEAEGLRLLYVATTRAKNMLVISRSLKDKAMKKNPWASLLNEALEMDNLEIPDQSQITIVTKVASSELTKEALKKGEQDFLRDIAEISTPSYSLTSPTSLKGEEQEPQVKRLEGGGMAWGTVIHTIFEQMLKGKNNLDVLIPQLLKENNLPLERQEEAKQVVSEFINSTLWQRIQQANSKYSEMPFTLKIEPGHKLFDLVGDGNGIPVILNGVIDLIYEDADGWVVVDYKTDRPENEADVVTLQNIYSKQIKIYCHVWEELTGLKVKSGEIYFTSLNEIRKVF